MKEEKNITTCRVCNNLKQRIQDGMFDERNKRWVDEHGDQWVGLKCPDCVREYNKNRQRNKREKQ